MIEKLVNLDWDSPPEDMDFSIELIPLLKNIRQNFLSIEENVANSEKHLYELYLKIPGLITTLLNYKINVRERGFSSSRLGIEQQNILLQANANTYLLSGILTSKKLISLESDADFYINQLIEKFEQDDNLRNLGYESKKDKYTWRASNPCIIKNLFTQLKDKDISLVIGSAHGAIRPALYLSSLLNTDLYFLRYSRFKIEDREPIIDDFDKAFLNFYRSKNVLLIDEDVAQGKTLKGLSDKIMGLFDNILTASVLCHYLATFKPDYVGDYWY